MPNCISLIGLWGHFMVKSIKYSQHVLGEEVSLFFRVWAVNVNKIMLPLVPSRGVSLHQASTQVPLCILWWFYLHWLVKPWKRERLFSSKRVGCFQNVPLSEINFLYRVLFSTHSRILPYVTREWRKIKGFGIATSEFLDGIWRKFGFRIFLCIRPVAQLSCNFF